MKASVIVPVRNGSAVIHRCLHALASQDLPRDQYEIIVVDDGSTDDTVAFVAGFPDVRLLSTPPRGPAAARNRGIAAAQGDVILFTDADCAPRSDWARTMLDGLERSGADGAKGIYETHQRSLVARFVQIEYETRYARMARRAHIDFIDTYSAAYRREVLTKVGGFDERFPFPSVEDQELSFRVTERGYRLAFVPDAVVDHLHAATVRAYARKKFRIGYWKVAVLAAHPGRAIDDAHTPQSLKAQIILTYLLGATLLASPLLATLLPAALIGASLLATWAPFIAYAARRDLAVTAVCPGLLLVRAAALGAGFAWGLLHKPRPKADG